MFNELFNVAFVDDKQDRNCIDSWFDQDHFCLVYDKGDAFLTENSYFKYKMSL